MSVYREFFTCIEILENNSGKIHKDAADYGAPCKKGDEIWNAGAQLAEWYGEESTKVYSTNSVTITIEGIDEWAVSDGRKTVKEATEKYQLSYVITKKLPGFDGFFTLDKI